MEMDILDPICDACGLPVLDDGSGCICIITDAKCSYCKEEAPSEIIATADGDAFALWVIKHMEHGAVEIKTGFLQ